MIMPESMYDKSPIPASKPGGIATERNPDRAIRTDADGHLNYDSAAAEGMVQVFLPALPGDSHTQERLLAKNFGVHVAGKIEAAFKKQPYLQSGATQSPDRVFRHYLGAAKGSGLVDSGTFGRMEKLAAEFEAESEQQEYFQQVLKPYLFSLTPKRRTRANAN
jgi:hypothetical protein